MKGIIILVATMIMSVTYAQEASFEAEIIGNQLLVTTEVDNCNGHSLTVAAAPNCAKGLTKDFVEQCKITFGFISTKKGCLGPNEVRTFSYDLNKLNLRNTIKSLKVVGYNEDDSVEIELPRKEVKPIPHPSEYISAVVDGNDLFVTVLVDSCNSFSAGLIIQDNCKAPSETTDYVTSCNATLSIIGTKMLCTDRSSKAKTFTFKIDELNLRSSVDTLSISLYTIGERVDVRIK